MLQPVMAYTFSVEPNPSDADLAAIQAGLSQYNEPFASWEGAGPMTIFLRDEQGALAGGLLGYTFWGWLHVEMLWLAEAARRQDYGSRMLELAEVEARRRGCANAYVDTTSFQALPFYQKHGYTLWGQLDDFPKGHSRYFMKKALGGPNPPSSFP